METPNRIVTIRTNPPKPKLRRDPHQILVTEQPVNWVRAIFCGMLGAFMLSAMVWLVAGMGLVNFSLEHYLGTLLYSESGGGVGYRPWIVGFFANLILGGIFGIAYATFFEYQAKRADVRVGLYLGVFHMVLAAATVFPAFNVIHEFMTDPAAPLASSYANFGFLGYGFSADLCAALIVGHVLFGVIMGGLYGPVREERVWMRHSEPRADEESWGEMDADDTHGRVSGEQVPRRVA